MKPAISILLSDQDCAALGDRQALIRLMTDAAIGDRNEDSVLTGLRRRVMTPGIYECLREKHRDLLSPLLIADTNAEGGASLGALLDLARDNLRAWSGPIRLYRKFDLAAPAAFLALTEAIRRDSFFTRTADVQLDLLYAVGELADAAHVTYNQCRFSRTVAPLIALGFKRLNELSNSSAFCFSVDHNEQLKFRLAMVRGRFDHVNDLPGTWAARELEPGFAVRKRARHLRAYRSYHRAETILRGSPDGDEARRRMMTELDIVTATAYRGRLPEAVSDRRHLLNHQQRAGVPMPLDSQLQAALRTVRTKPSQLDNFRAFLGASQAHITSQLGQNDDEAHFRHAVLRLLDIEITSATRRVRLTPSEVAQVLADLARLKNQHIHFHRFLNRDHWLRLAA